MATTKKNANNTDMAIELQEKNPEFELFVKEENEINKVTTNSTEFVQNTPPIEEASEFAQNIEELGEKNQEQYSLSTTETLPSGTVLDSEMTTIKKSRRRKKAEEDQTQSSIISAESEVLNTESEAKIPKRRDATKRETVLSINERRTVETAEDRAKNDLLDLLESKKTGKILSGSIQGVERSEDNHSRSFAVIYHGAYKVIIPAEETVELPADLRDQNPEDVQHYLLTKRLGAEIDYIVKGLDANEKIAVASRKDAMRAKRKQYYFGTDRDGNNLLYSGLCAEARVVSVIRAGIFAELCGLEVYVPMRELSYQRLMDASSYFQPGQRILVKILEVDRSDRNNIKATVSVKQASENPYEQALKKYTVGNRYVGTVSMVDTNGVFVALDGGIDCLCSYPKRGRPPRGARVTVRVLGISHDTNRIWGAITHTATPR